MDLGAPENGDMMLYVRAVGIGLMMVVGVGGRAETDSGFVEKLSAEEYAAAGLAKLSIAERVELDRLVAIRSAGGLDTRRAETVGLETVADGARIKRTASAVKARRIESVLVGRFIGWTGASIFTLENGQRWMQIDGTEYSASPQRDRPAVFLLPASMDTYFLKVDGVGMRCRVKLLDD
jgi:hypothetical protein